MKIPGLSKLFMVLLGLISSAVWAAPDLVVQSTSVSPSTIQAGGSLSLACSVKNSGTTRALSSSLKYYLSRDAQYNSSDTIFPVADLVSALDPGASSPEDATVTIPSGTLPGTWYILFRADANSQISETSETNNVASRQITVAGPDLTVSSISLSTGTAPPGGTVGTSCTVRNLGGAQAGTSSLKYYLSSNSSWDGADTLLDVDLVGGLAPGANSLEDADLAIPAGTSFGSWYILCHADANAQITETNETNNVGSRQITVAGPDLTVSSISLGTGTVPPGGTVSTSCTVRNLGGAHAGTSSLKYYLSSNSSWDGNDSLLDVDLVGGLAPGADSPEDADLIVPTGTSLGSWYILCRADANAQITEANETNNVASRLLTVVGPDLTVSNISLGTGTVPPGGTVNTSCTVRNLGGAHAGTSSLKYYLSGNSSWDGADSILDVDLVGGLAPGADSPEDADLVIPAGTSPGSWYILCRADANAQLTETNEGNNTAAASLSVASGSPFQDLPTSHWAYPAALYLYQRGFLQPDANGNVRPNDSLLRAELAKLAFLGAEIPPFADNFPNPFNDLQERNAQTEWYYSYAKNLSYLEFGDGVPPFRRDRFNFYPSASITRAHSLKVLVETWNLPIQSSGSLPYSDVPASHESYRYVLTAYSRGLIDPQQSQFRPDDSTLRAESFVMLYNLMSVRDIPPPDVESGDFFTAGNYTPANLGSRRSLVNGNFRHLTRTSFEIPGVRLPLLFAHAYNSYLTELPEQVFPVRPLGHGWTHTFNSYLLPIDQHLIVFWPDGRLHVYRSEGDSVVSVTKGVYDTLTRVSSTQYTIRKKNQLVFTYEKLSGSAADFPFVLTRITDRNSNQLVLAYEAAARSGGRRLRTVTDFAGRTLTFTYHAASDLIREVTDPLARRISFDYDVYGAEADLVTFRDAKQQLTQYAYNSAAPERHLLLTATLPRGNTITNTYEERKLRSTRQGTRPAVQLTYQRNYNQTGSAGYVVTDVTEPGRVFQVSTSRDDTVNQVTGPAGFQATYEYGDAGHPTLPTRIVGADGVQLDLTYDARGNVLRVDRPLAVTERFVHTAGNDLLQYTDPRGKVTRFGYDSRGNLLSVTDPLDHVTTFAWDVRGLLTSVTNPANVTFTFSYDAYGNRTGVLAPLGISTSATYDAAGRVLTAADPRSFTRQYTYDNNDNVLSATDLFTTSFGYDGNDNLTSVTNAKGGVTSWSYNPEDLLDTMEFQGARTDYAYYEDGLLSQRTDSDGQSITYQYDDLGRLISDSQGNQYAYDPRGNLETAINSLGKIVFEYDALNRLASTTDMFGNTLGYEYDKAGNVVKMIYPGGKAVIYAYYDDGRLRSVEDWLGGVATYEYRQDGLVSSIRYPNGMQAGYRYDSAGRLVQLDTAGMSGTLASYRFILDRAGNHVGISSTEPIAGSLWRYSGLEMQVDSANRLILAGSRLSRSDARGNLIEKGERVFSYDLHNQLIRVEGGESLVFAYDAIGGRRLVRRAGRERRYVLDFLSPLQEGIMETDGHGGVLYYYIYGLGLLSRIDASGNTRYLHYDSRGSVIALTDRDQRVTHRYSYDAFGLMSNAEEEDENRFLLAGRYGVMHEGDGLYYMKSRYYDAEVGRFLSEDPIWSVNLYRYAGDNPIMNIDPSGMSYISLDFNIGVTIFKFKVGYSGSFRINSDLDYRTSNLLIKGSATGNSATLNGGLMFHPGDINQSTPNGEVSGSLSLAAITRKLGKNKLALGPALEISEGGDLSPGVQGGFNFDTGVEIDVDRREIFHAQGNVIEDTTNFAERTMCYYEPFFCDFF